MAFDYQTKCTSGKNCDICPPSRRSRAVPRDPATLYTIGDILYNSPTIALKNILFYLTTLKDIYKSILKARNIVLRIDKIFIRVLYLTSTN